MELRVKADTHFPPRTLVYLCHEIKRRAKGQGKRAGGSSKLILREASQEKRKGKEDRCTVHQWFVCNTIAGYESPGDHYEMSYKV